MFRISERITHSHQNRSGETETDAVGIVSIMLLGLEMESTKLIHWYSLTTKSLFPQITIVYSLSKVIIQLNL